MALSRFKTDFLISNVRWCLLCLAEPGLFEPDDPLRQKIEAMRAKGAIRIWYPLPLEWRL